MAIRDGHWQPGAGPPPAVPLPAARTDGPSLPVDTRLTRREREVLSLILAGATDKAIAHALGISPRTASHHVGSILRKLHVETRAGARRWAAAAGFAQMPPPSLSSLPAGAESGASPS